MLESYLWRGYVPAGETVKFEISKSDPSGEYDNRSKWIGWLRHLAKLELSTLAV